MDHLNAVGLYLHVPFCQTKCSYCDFNTYAGLEQLIPSYVAGLRREIESWSAAELGVRTIFFGGGTPSLLAPGEIQSILESVRLAFAFPRETEVTIEANPGTVDVTRLTGMRRAGVTRLSLGAQSFSDDELRGLTRLHTAAEIVQAVRAARDAEYESINLDLMYALPAQTLGRWRWNLERALELDPEHLSLYALTVEPGTPLSYAVRRGEVSQTDPDLAADMYELACKLVSGAGYQQYEISNWAKPGYECRHNLVYWRNEPYLGLGAGAHSCFHGRRFSNLRLPKRYVEATRAAEAIPGHWHPLPGLLDHSEELSPQRALEDTLFMGLRLNEGVDENEVQQRHGTALRQRYSAELAELQASNLVTWEGTRLRLTAPGRLLANEVFIRLLDLAA